jgi:hypothetical protein
VKVAGLITAKIKIKKSGIDDARKGVQFLLIDSLTCDTGKLNTDLCYEN